MIFTRKGFTLIEVLIVVLIIGILACVAMPVLEGAKIKAQFSQVFVTVSRIEREINLGLAEESWDHMEDFNWRIMDKVVGEIDKDGDWHNNISDGKFEYYVRSSADLVKIQAFILAGTPQTLCYRWITPDDRYWVISDTAQPWAKYLRQLLPDAQ